MELFLINFSDPGTYIGLLSLVAMLIVLDIDNVVFMTILGMKLPKEQQRKSLSYGLFIGLGFRILLLMGIGYLTALEEPLFSINWSFYQNDFTWKAIVTLVGGIFLIAKSTTEIHDKLEGPDPDKNAKNQAVVKFWNVVGQISFLNLIFSIDSVITAVGMTNSLYLMIIGMAISMGVIFIFAHPISRFVQKHPTMKMLGLAFLLLIGVLLVTEGLHVEIPKGYVYFAMGFALAVEFLNISVRKKGRPVQLHIAHYEEDEDVTRAVDHRLETEDPDTAPDTMIFRRREAPGGEDSEQ